MSYLSPHPSSSLPGRRRRWWRAAIGWAAVLILAHLVDGWGWEHWRVADAEARALMESKDWYRLLRVAGYLPTWIVVGLVGFLVAGPDRAAPGGAAGGSRRESPGTMALLVPVAAGLGGLMAEVVKVVIRRGRPGDFDGEYGWYGLGDGLFDTSRLGMASSHAGVAFGAAFAVMHFHRRAGWVVLPMAVGCGLTRVLAGQHFVSDIAGGAVLGWLAARWVSPGVARGR